MARTWNPPEGWVVDLPAWRAGYLVRRAYAAALPAVVRRPVRAAGELPAQVLGFSGVRDLPEQVAGIRALLRTAGRPEAFTVVSDGTHTGAQRRLLEAVDPCVRVVHWRAYVDRHLPEAGGAGRLPDAVARYAAASPLGRKLAVEVATPVRRPTVYVDADVLLLPPAAELRERLDRPAFLLDEEDVYLDRRLLDDEQEARPPCNAGLLVLPERPDWGPALARLDRLGDELPSFHTEQTVVHLALRAAGAQPLDPRRYVVATDDMRTRRDAHARPDVVLRHFTSPVRHRFWTTLLRQARAVG